jgi:hypothetical protein
MKRLFGLRVLALGICLQGLVAASTFADGPYAIELSRCLVKSTTSADKTLLVQWMFATIALHPDVKWMAEVTENQRADLNKKTGALFEKLLTEICLDQARQALKNEGEGTLAASFSSLGQVASRELFANPSVAAGMDELGKQIDTERVRKILGSSK